VALGVREGLLLPGLGMLEGLGLRDQEPVAVCVLDGVPLTVGLPVEVIESDPEGRVWLQVGVLRDCEGGLWVSEWVGVLLTVRVGDPGDSDTVRVHEREGGEPLIEQEDGVGLKD